MLLLILAELWLPGVQAVRPEDELEHRHAGASVKQESGTLYAARKSGDPGQQQQRPSGLGHADGDALVCDFDDNKRTAQQECSLEVVQEESSPEGGNAQPGGKKKKTEGKGNGDANSRRVCKCPPGSRPRWK